MPDSREEIIQTARLEYLAAERRFQEKQHAKRLAYLDAERDKALAILAALGEGVP